jgi:hypothetical protein
MSAPGFVPGNAAARPSGEGSGSERSHGATAVCLLPTIYSSHHFLCPSGPERGPVARTAGPFLCTHTIPLFCRGMLIQSILPPRFRDCATDPRGFAAETVPGQRGPAGYNGRVVITNAVRGARPGFECEDDERDAGPLVDSGRAGLPETGLGTDAKRCLGGANKRRACIPGVGSSPRSWSSKPRASLRLRGHVSSGGQRS